MNDEPSPTPLDLGSWKHLLYVADAISQIPTDKNALNELVGLLNSLEVHFPRTIDPVDDFRAYAVRRFCMALRKTLFEMNNQK
jgi:hypothetical protein